MKRKRKQANEARSKRVAHSMQSPTFHEKNYRFPKKQTLGQIVYSMRVEPTKVVVFLLVSCRYRDKVYHFEKNRSHLHKPPVGVVGVVVFVGVGVGVQGFFYQTGTEGESEDDRVQL